MLVGERLLRVFDHGTLHTGMIGRPSLVDVELVQRQSLQDILRKSSISSYQTVSADFTHPKMAE